MVCPKCAGEYIEGVKVCVNCRILLVDDLSVNPTNGSGNGKLVHFMTCFSRTEAESGKNLLIDRGVEAIVSMDEIRGVRLWIHKENGQKAIQIFQERMATQKREGTQEG